jgi:polygalacturonase
MDAFRRDFLKLAASGAAGAAAGSVLATGAQAQAAPVPSAGSGIYDVRAFGATGDGKTIDTPAINKALQTAHANGGGTVRVPPGTYVCYSIHLKSNTIFYLEQGATIVAGPVPLDGTTTGGFDPAGPPQPWEAYQDYGHNHWHNSMIWGENLENFAIMGPGLIWGRGISVGRPKGYTAQPYDEHELTWQGLPGVANKMIALKNCRNVILRDLSLLKGGNFCILATGVDNLTIDNLKIDTNRDGIDIDCCHNVRITNCSVNSPYDDGISPKSSFALGYPRATENLTISNCFMTGAFIPGTMLDGTWKRWPANTKVHRNGRIKCGTESNGGFKNIAITNCVFEGGWGFALETVDGALLEEITFTGITMRDIVNTPILLRLGSRLRGPKGTKVGQLRRVILSNIVSYNSASEFGGGGIIAGIPGHSIADIKVNDCYFQHRAEAGIESTGRVPPENASAYPDPSMFGALPASGFFVRHVNNIEFTNVEIACADRDPRPAFWLGDVDGADFFFVKAPKAAAGNTISMHDVRDLRTVATRNVADLQEERIDSKVL